MIARALVLTLLSLAGTALAPRASATFITANSLASPTTVDFSQFVAAPQVGVAGPLQIGGLVGEDISLSGEPFLSSFSAFDGIRGLGGNGLWSDRGGFVAHSADIAGVSSTITITFEDGLVSGVGAFMNYCPDCNASSLVISAYDSDDFLLEAFLLESWDVTDLADIVTPGALNDGGFRGIQRATADIRSFRISGAGLVLDDLAFTRSPIPEPGSGALLAFGLVAAAAWWRPSR